MSAPDKPSLSKEEEEALHRRLLEGDPTASADLAVIFLDHLIAWLIETNTSLVPENLCAQAAADALIALIKRPRSFDAAKGKGLTAYLRMSAKGDLRNILQNERRYKRRNACLDDVELSLVDGKYLDPASDLLSQEEWARMNDTIVAPARHGLSEAEARALDLLIDGQRKTALFAEALGISDLPEAEQKIQVKRVKDKLKIRLKRQARPNVQEP